MATRAPARSHRAAVPFPSATAPALAVDAVDTRYLETLIGYNARRAALRIIEAFIARMAVFDIEQMEALADDAALGLNLYVPLEVRAGRLNLRLYHLGSPVPLSQSLPMLEKMMRLCEV